MNLLLKKTIVCRPVLFGHNIRYTIQLNARAAFHLLELRTTRQGHPNYRVVCQEMHKLIKEKQKKDPKNKDKSEKNT